MGGGESACSWCAHRAPDVPSPGGSNKTALERCQNESSSSIPGRICQAGLFLGKVSVKIIVTC